MSPAQPRALSAPRAAPAVPPAVVSFLAVTATTALGDLATKAWAVHALAGRHVHVAPGFSLRLVYNTASAGGVWIGEYTLAINALATLLAVLLTGVAVLPLARVDRLAPITLGLIAGGATGNLASLLGGPAGVADFLAFGYDGGAVILNMADVAVVAGLGLLLRSIARLGGAIRQQGGE
jgi:signal peptidase II